MKKLKTPPSTDIDYDALWRAKCRAWKCRPIYIWDDNFDVYPHGLALAKDGRTFLIDGKGAREVTLAQSARLFARLDAKEDGGTYGAAYYRWFRTMAEAMAGQS